LTEFRCEAEAASITVSAGAPQGDTSLLPLERPLTFEVCAPRPRSVALVGQGALPRVVDGSGPGWWHDGQFLHVRVAGQPVTVRAIL
jgi:hypothetical protein